MNLKKVRRNLHRLAELSGCESKTSEYIRSILQEYNPSKLVSGIAGHGLCAEFNFKNTGPTIMLRADLDALPITAGESEYCSHDPNVSHRCGHDGHMAMILGVLQHLEGFNKGRLILFFQPAEETGQGALFSLQDEYFKNLKVDLVLGLHNIPGEKLGRLFYAKKHFSCASTGLRIILEGVSSHAATPDLASCVFQYCQELINYCESLNSRQEDENYQIITNTYLNIGSDNFGITPGGAQINFTLRSIEESKIMEMLSQIKVELKRLDTKFDIKTRIELLDQFPDLINDEHYVEQIISKLDGVDLCELSFPFKWSEDFGHLARKYSSMYFGLGAGEQCLPLHHQEYDFPDSLIDTGVNLYSKMVKQFLT